MSDQTKIEWCDATLNAWWGCTKVSDGCKHCYADSWSKRYNRAIWGPKGTRVEVKSWRSTLNKISKRALAEGRRLKVFVQSMSDTFEGPETMGGVDSENWKLVSRLRQELLELIPEHPELDFLLLTKRPENVLKYGRVGMAWMKDGVPPNAWVGVSIEGQLTADDRLSKLAKIPAAVRFVSCEPMIGPVDIEPYLRCPECNYSNADARLHMDHFLCSQRGGLLPPEIHWVIFGGESGPKARPMHPDWVRSLRDQCVAANVPFFFKQWGEWLPWMEFSDAHVDDDIESSRYLACYFEDGKWTEPEYAGWDSDMPDDTVGRVGKSRAGRMLDGRTWDEVPR